MGNGRSSRSGEFDSSYETFLRDRVDLVEVDGTGESDFLEPSFPLDNLVAPSRLGLDVEAASVPGLLVDCRLHGAEVATEVDIFAAGLVDAAVKAE
jgi:hypothetical protein